MAMLIITAMISFVAGLAIEWSRHWGLNWFARYNIRRAIRAEITGVVITLNFFIRTAMDAIPDQDSIAVRYFEPSLHLEAFDFYWGQKREELLRLPEWSRLKNWTESLSGIRNQEHPALFTAITLFQGLLIPPLSKCSDRASRTVIQNALSIPAVSEYKLDYLLRKTGIRKDHPVLA